MGNFRAKPTGWRYESSRHSLAAKGVSTNKYFYKRQYPGSRAIGKYSSGTLGGMLRNVAAEKERQRIEKSISAGKDLEARAKFEAARAQSQKGITEIERQLVEHKIAVALSPASFHEPWLVRGRKWIRETGQHADELGELKEKLDDAAKENDVKRVAEIRAEVKKKYVEFKNVRKNLDKVSFPVVGDEKVLDWAEKQASIRVKRDGKKVNKEKIKGKKKE